jgi:MFS transporter, ACS family, tartrate transporter
LFTVTADESLANRTRRKVSRRILFFVFVLYIVAYLDRANVAFAKIDMMADLGFSEAVIGFGAGVFFLGYLFFEIPGAIIVERWSARKWIARILITWGFCTVFVGFVQTPKQFYLARFLLGAAEAGFFPGVIVYLSHWFVQKDRASAMSGFILAIPVAVVLGAPLSGLILYLDWFGLAGWRWVFILEGLPAVLLGVVTLFYLTDHPHQAKWLVPDEQQWITAQLQEEKRRKRAIGQLTVWQALRQRNVILLAVALYFGNTGAYAFLLWLPSMIRNNSNLSVNLATICSALPFACAIVSIRLLGRSSDRCRERKLHTAVPMLLAAVFLSLSTIPGQPFLLLMGWLCLTGAAVYSASVPFWVLPTAILGESAAAASIGLINSIGALGGFVGPTVMGYLLSLNFAFTTTILLLSASFLVGGILILMVQLPRDIA